MGLSEANSRNLHQPVGFLIAKKDGDKSPSFFYWVGYHEASWDLCVSGLLYRANLGLPLEQQAYGFAEVDSPYCFGQQL